ncbi:hypothetical protein NDI85_21515 [Halomicroarcula sp. S1AR25-4]|uniref:hypothetical protein n=1 Tax=Haloarcula sp. S1AR25-4 TaxID=2950538 RepID=UPI002873F845|nr:hypothetical protein [Halomicroarcula sp. S1AR25-4]MDS0280368.1 hypothetical protein [Halomicroarcula sp. S1AR25-4]
MTRETDKDRLHSQELLKRAQGYHHRNSLPREEYEALMAMGSELANPVKYDAQFFVLGSYNPNEKPKLEYLKTEANSWPGVNCRAYLMEDLADDLHPMVQFRVIADYSDSIIAICEHDQGGFQLELGMLLALSEYQDRFHLLKRSYSDTVEREKYNWMLDAGAFDLFDYQDRLHEWRDSAEFKAEVDTLLTDLLE